MRAKISVVTWPRQHEAALSCPDSRFTRWCLRTLLNWRQTHSAAGAAAAEPEKQGAVTLAGDRPQFWLPHPSRLALCWIHVLGVMLVNKIQLFFFRKLRVFYYSNLIISRGSTADFFFLWPFIQAIHGQRLPGVVIVFLGRHAFEQLLLVDAEGEDQMTHDDLPKLFLSVSITAGHISVQQDDSGNLSSCCWFFLLFILLLFFSPLLIRSIWVSKPLHNRSRSLTFGFQLFDKASA